MWQMTDVGGQMTDVGEQMTENSEYGIRNEEWISRGIRNKSFSPRSTNQLIN